MSRVRRRRELRRAALSYARHGWPVVPAAYYDGRRYVCVRANCDQVGPHPVWQSWQERATSDLATVRSWYRLCTFSIALPTGVGFDVLRVPEPWAERLQGLLGAAGACGPTAVWPERNCRLFWVAGGLRLDESCLAAGFRLHGEADWVPAPPSRTRGGPVRWSVSPERNRWRPAELAPVRDALDVISSGLARPPAGHRIRVALGGSGRR
jgi:hypothetical protein